MGKTKLGVSVELLAAAVFFVALFGGYTPVLLVAGYILLVEENAWLKKAAIKSVALLTAISLITYVIGLVPDVFDWLSSFLRLIGLNISFSIISSIVYLFTSAIAIVKILFFVLSGVKALKGETVAISSLDAMLDKYADDGKAEA
jgi:uncharacterized membrane protein